MAVTKFYYILYFDMHNFKIARSHNEASAVRDWAKSIGVDKEQIEVKLVTEDMKLAESAMLELVKAEYEAEAEVKERDRLTEPIITTYDIYISRLREIGLDNIVKTPELEEAYRDWMHESGYNYYTPQT
ncbi:hypothetical protein UFOVP782_17 [uncultured Caudovirales phage]|uniref:Uncharacterized protein n=1 Tax=uncultured Caudovirales phage TaxID=2100421 RepID=A0A6J5NYP3_9CAUD|nr:hypothetical protein UFOVP782_17 [uncultured Caudovirales phage]